MDAIAELRGVLAFADRCDSCGEQGEFAAGMDAAAQKISEYILSRIRLLEQKVFDGPEQT